MKSTYRVMQVPGPGVLEMAERPVPVPGPGQVLIAVEACGICGADTGDIENIKPSAGLSRVPGHEVVGRIVAMAPATPSIWKLNQRVGVGRLGGHCGECAQCRRGEFHLCRNQPFVGATCDGGYAEMMLARATGLVSIPDELRSEEAAPILCAGLATFNALKKSGAHAGDTVAVLGIGGLGHMAVQYARRMGFRVVAIGRGEDIRSDALALGAHLYLDAEKDDVAQQLQSIGGAQAIVATVGKAELLGKLMAALAPQGRLVVLGGGTDPLAVSLGPLVVGERSVAGSITGSPYDNERALDFSVLSGVRARIETMPFEQAPQAYQRMKSGEAKFRVVLVMGSPDSAMEQSAST